LVSVDTSTELVNGTFRDPQGRLYREGNRFLREIYPEHGEQVLSWIRSPLALHWMRESRLVHTEILVREAGESFLLEHEPVFFPSYPWEWTPGQWKHAAALTLDLCQEALESGYVLKDATPLNILFSGSRALFVDVLSFERRDVASPLWLAQAQFVRTFLLPLTAYIHLGWPLAATKERRDGYEPADLGPWLGFFQRWLKPFRSLVTIPLLLQKRIVEKNAKTRSWRLEMSEEVTRSVVRRTLRATRKSLDSLVLPAHATRWSSYTDRAEHYRREDHSAKEDFVRRALERMEPGKVLDVGANTGLYSRIAAATGAEVVAWDTDVGAAEINWQAANRAGLSILPIIADFARPTPALGWRNAEAESLLSRSEGRFDCVLMLGILHHLLIADQIPLPAIVDQLARISTRWAILEWIPQNDSQFLSLSRGRDSLYAHLSEEYFLQVLRGRFSIRERLRLPNGRTLWLAEKSA
jgi:2-polyprenyl-3-methyl-5-hydroxy-6-metoxy-1,4-benzoquinol methylase